MTLDFGLPERPTASLLIQSISPQIFQLALVWHQSCQAGSMPLLDNLFAVGWIRKAIWRSWYPFLTRRLQGEGVFFLNYAFEEEPPMGIALPPAWTNPIARASSCIIMWRRRRHCAGRTCWR